MLLDDNTLLIFLTGNCTSLYSDTFIWPAAKYELWEAADEGDFNIRIFTKQQKGCKVVNLNKIYDKEQYSSTLYALYIYICEILSSQGE